MFLISKSSSYKLIDLLHTEVIYIFCLIALVPVGSEDCTLFGIQTRLPAETGLCLVDVEHQEVCLMEGIRIAYVLQLTKAEVLDDGGCYLPNGQDTFCLRAEVPAFAITGWIVPHLLSEKHVA